MLRSLRFQLPAFFLLGAVIAGLVSAVIALRLFQSYAQTRAREQAYAELAREARGITELYQQRAGLKLLSAKNLERATGDNIFYVGLDPFPGQGPAFQRLPVKGAALKKVRVSHPVRIEFQRAGKQTLLGVARPLKIGQSDLWLDRGGQTQDGAEPALVRADRAAADRLCGRARSLPPPSRGTSRAGSRALCSSSRKLPTRSHAGTTTWRCPQVPGGGEIGLLADRFREMAARLSEAEELERNFLMSVSHELRTPLTAIRGHVEALREGVVTDEEMRLASLTVIAAEAERLERLVGDVLDLAKLDARRFTVLHEEVDMGRLVDRAFVTFGEEARRRGIDYRCAVDAKPVIVTDGDRVLQIISNLLSNAFRWTPDGGSIELELKAVERHGLRRGGRQRARDPAGERERIFRPFWSRDGGGTGLGLAIARELAAALGGEIRLKSSPERGSRFELVLPSAPE